MTSTNYGLTILLSYTFLTGPQNLYAMDDHRGLKLMRQRKRNEDDKISGFILIYQGIGRSKFSRLIYSFALLSRRVMT